MNSSHNDQRNAIGARLHIRSTWKQIMPSVKCRRVQNGLLALVFGMLMLTGWSGQACGQAPAPNLYGEWASLVSPVVPVSPLKELRQPDPSGLLNEAPLPAERIPGNTNYSNRQNRGEQTLAVQWSQPELRHRQLYFQDDQIERGNAERRLPNVAAGAHFVKSLFAFPIRLVTGK